MAGANTTVQPVILKPPGHGTSSPVSIVADLAPYPEGYSDATQGRGFSSGPWDGNLGPNGTAMTVWSKSSYEGDGQLKWYPGPLDGTHSPTPTYARLLGLVEIQQRLIANLQGELAMTTAEKNALSATLERAQALSDQLQQCFQSSMAEVIQLDAPQDTVDSVGGSSPAAETTPSSVLTADTKAVQSWA